MHVIRRRKLQDFWDIYYDSRNSLEAWYNILKSTDFKSFADLRKTFNSADQVKNLTIFNIGGNK